MHSECEKRLTTTTTTTTTSYGIGGNLLNWFKHICGRYQRVVLECSYSDWVPVDSGVPLGSIIGPLLFIIFINDLPINVNSSKCMLVADDANCYRCISTVNDCIALQKDIDQLNYYIE